MNGELKKLLLWLVPGIAAVFFAGWGLAERQHSGELERATTDCTTLVNACEQHSDEQVALCQSQHESSKEVLSAQIDRLTEDNLQLRSYLFREIMEEAADAVMGRP